MDDVIDFTPTLRAQALMNLSHYVWEATPYIAPQVPDGKVLGGINVGNTVGGINWPGASFDPETATFYGQANNSSVNATSLTESYVQTVRPETQKESGRGPIWDPAAKSAALASAPARTRGAAAPAGERAGLNTGLEGLPIAKPPYGVLTAIDLNTGETKFKVPHGDTPDNVRATLQRLGVNYPEKTGQAGSVGLMVTKTLVIVGDPQVTAPPGRMRGAMLRAYDKKSGREVGAVWMPAQQSGSPMTYMADGRQYIVVAVQGTAGAGGQYIAYALPK
jgi:quinoprotein glucose dehydrogenase